MKKIRHLATVSALSLAAALTAAGSTGFAQSDNAAAPDIAASALAGTWLLELDSSIAPPKSNPSNASAISTIPNTLTDDPNGAIFSYELDIRARGKKISRCTASATQDHLPPVSSTCTINKNKLEIRLSESGAGVVVASLSKKGNATVFTGEAEMEHPGYPIKLPAGKVKLSPLKAN